MALLGTYIDRQSVSRAGDAFLGVTLGQTLNHSLATTPDTLLPVLRSAQAVGIQQMIAPIGLGGNASILTYGFVAGSGISCPTIMFDVYAIYWHSIVR